MGQFSNLNWHRQGRVAEGHGASQILFGTDYPIEKIESTIDELPATKLTAAELRAIDRENAERLFPRLR